MDASYRAAEEAARYAYGRLLAFLARRAGDMTLAEDALADAFAAALERWPSSRVPERPEAWLMTAARRRLIDGARRTATQQRTMPLLAAAARDAEHLLWRDGALPDERLEMLFACAHPAIDAAVRTPLVLRAALGVDAGRIASAFCVSPAAMRQRLVRATRKIRDAKIAFDVPSGAELHARSTVVLDAVYAAFGLSWDDGDADGASDLNQEAMWLARMLRELMPEEPEASGLLALVLFVEARRDARRLRGAYVPLDEQDPALWSAAMLEEAERVLLSLPPAGGRYQLEAAIQAHHVARRRGAPTDWAAIACLYDRLAATGALGALVSRAAAHARAYGDEAGLAALHALAPERVVAYQPYWAVRAHLTGEAADYERAIGLARDEATREFLMAKRDAVRR